MFHVSDNLYFGRINDAGDVRILKFNSPPPLPPNPTGTYSESLVSVDLTLPGSSWASVMASVSRRGEIEGRFYVAQAFHNNVEALARWDGVMP